MDRPLRDKVLQQLGEEITSGQLPPGSPINERGIGERFGISRTPAREVLLQLSSAGLVQLMPRHGAVVVRLSPRDVVSMVEVLVALEGEAASLATRRMEKPERQAIAAQDALAAETIERMSEEDYSEANIIFHGLIYTGCRNQFLTDEIKALRLRLAPYFRQSFIRQGRMLSSHAEHQAVVAAICNYDESAAKAAMRQHILNGGNLFADMIAKL